ncbi:M23 family metallopeptidase [Haliangium sp.]|uniref:M23 family metallopeptidase n=1 Tax=Haliangium sp. TaxID=2663208 RepID=UPI003D13485C
MAGADGRVVSLCPECWHGRAESGEPGDIDEADEADEIGVGPTGRNRWQRHGAGLALVAAVTLAIWQLRAQVPPRSAAAGSLTQTATQTAAQTALAMPGHSSDVAGHDQADQTGAAQTVAGLDLRDELAGDEGEEFAEGADPSVDVEDIELPPTLEDRLESDEVDGEEALLIGESFPTLNDWVFPVLDSDEDLPLKPTRRFGAKRDGVARSECGRGHCGVDLDGPRGTPVVAVAWGVVKRIQRASDRRSGKYVKIEHPDYVYTSYMHLDDIADGLAVGDEIDAGDVVGTLGRTGIKHSAPHLHFSLEVPRGSRLLHVDPIPFLSDAERMPADDDAR